MGKGEQQPLLRKTRGSVRFNEDSLRETSSSTRPLTTTSTTASSDNNERRSFLHSSSSLSQVFQKLTRSERVEALQKEGVGGAAFLIRDAVLGDANPTAGTKEHGQSPTYLFVTLVCFLTLLYLCVFRIYRLL